MDGPPVTPRWAARDWIAAVALFAVSAAIVVWQDLRLAVLWDLSYVLDTAARIAAGQMPYRDFPLAHAPLTFLLQALVMRVFGHAFLHHVAYAACAGAVGTVVAWRIVLRVLGGVEGAWMLALVLSAPLCLLGVYSILPMPSYDCDCALSILVSILLLQRAETRWRAAVAGAALVVPVFFKQNMGLPYLLAAGCGIGLLVVARRIRREPVSALVTVLAAAAGAMAASSLVLQATAGVGNYLHWTVQFAAQRRLPGLGAMLEVYEEPSLLWTLPCVAAAVVVLVKRWPAAVALALLAAPFVGTLVKLGLGQDADDRAAALLAVWPMLLVLALVWAAFELRRGVRFEAVLPWIVLGAIHGTLLSQQLWGSTYAIWPLLVVLIAGMVAAVARLGLGRLALPLAGVIALPLAVGGGCYVASAERLSYARVLEGPAVRATLPQLAGMTVHGDSLPGFEELVRFAEAEIPAQDGLILLPGEDPFYFVTGRTPRFPVLLFDPATDPLSPQQVVDQVRAREVRWLIVKRQMQMTENPMPDREATLALLQREFTLYRSLKNYDVYRR